MSTIIEIENELNEPLEELEEVVRSAVDCAVRLELEDKPAEVSILLTDDEGIQALNADFRGIDAPTDVLSFPANELSGPISEAFLNAGFMPEMQEGCLILGDIAISVPRARAQAEEYGHSLSREMAFLAAHGTLHLMGYDHISLEDDRMRMRQRAVMEELHLSREEDE